MFKPYSVHELHYIFESRVDSTLFAKDLLQKLAEAIVKKGDDARSALDYLRLAIRQSLEQLKDDGATSTGPLVFFKHLVKAEQEKGPSLRKRIHGLPTMGKCVLCILTTLAKDQCMKVPLRDLRRYVLSCMHETNRGDDMLTTDDFVFLVETIVDMGLLNATSRKLSIFENHKIELAIQPDEVVEILQEDLKQSFYQNMMARAAERKNTI
jgi:Cdc6-like AAA superfamily ATPase